MPNLSSKPREGPSRRSLYPGSHIEKCGDITTALKRVYTTLGEDTSFIIPLDEQISLEERPYLLEWHGQLMQDLKELMRKWYKGPMGLAKNGAVNFGANEVRMATPKDKAENTNGNPNNASNINISTTGNHSTTADPTTATTNTSKKRDESSRATALVSASVSNLYSTNRFELLPALASVPESENAAVVLFDPSSQERANKRMRTGTQDAADRTEESSTRTSFPTVRVVTTKAVRLDVINSTTASLKIKSPANFITKRAHIRADKGTAEFNVKASREGLKTSINLDPGGKACVKTRGGLTYFIVETSGPTTFLIKEGVDWWKLGSQNYITSHPAPGGMVRFNADGIVWFQIEDDATTFEVDAGGQLRE